MKAGILLITIISIASTNSFCQVTDTINVLNESKNKREWTKNDLFKNQISPMPEIENKGNLIKLNIEAFQHDFSPSTAIPLPKTWVIGYVEDGKLPSLPSPFIETEYGVETKIKWTNKLKQTIIDNPKYPIFKLEDPLADKKCGGGATCTCGKTSGKFYPIIYNVADTFKIKVLQEAIYPMPKNNTMQMNGMEEASYWGTTVHLHGANLSWKNDGYPNSKYLTKADSTNPKYTKMSWGLFGPNEKKQSVIYHYPNTFPEGRFTFSKIKQKADTLGRHGGILWYHDHSMMRTATNVYSGLVGAYVIEGAEEKAILNETSIDNIPDVPLLISDKSFTNSGLLYYNTTQHSWYNTITHKTKTDSTDVNDIYREEGQPEFYGNTIVVNGKVWPNLKVGKGLYRFRILNTSSSKFYNLGFFYQSNNDETFKKLPDSLNSANSCIAYQIGTEGGFTLKHRPILTEGTTIGGANTNKYLTLAPGERADILVNFSNLPADFKRIVLGNFAPNEPYQKDTIVSFPLIAQNTNNDFNTNYVMSFEVDNYITTVNTKYFVKSISNKQLKLNLIETFDQNSKKKLRMLNNLSEEDNVALQYKNNITIDTIEIKLVEAARYEDFPISYKRFIEKNNLKENLSFPMVLMNGGDWNSEANAFYDTLLVNNIKSKDSIRTISNTKEEIWAINNTTDDTHPIHLHLNRFKVLYRVYDNGTKKDREISETGWKDVVRAKPHCTTYIKVRFILNEEQGDKKGNFVYHCHILEHEDMSMMRRVIITK